MVAFSKYNCFVEDVAEKKHDLGADVIKVALSNAAPNAATHATLADVSEIAAGNGYPAGGNAAAANASLQSGGTYKLTRDDPAAFVAAGGVIGPFRYAIMYNVTGGNRLIGYYDYGSNVTLNDGETFTVDLDGAAGVLTLA